MCHSAHYWPHRESVVPASAPRRTIPARPPGRAVPASQPRRVVHACLPGRTIPACPPWRGVPASPLGRVVPASLSYYLSRRKTPTCPVEAQPMGACHIGQWQGHKLEAFVRVLAGVWVVWTYKSKKMGFALSKLPHWYLSLVPPLKCILHKEELLGIHLLLPSQMPPRTCNLIHSAIVYLNNN